MTTLKSAYDAACGKLAYRMRTEKEIRDFLEKAGYATDEIAEAVADLKSFGYIDDARFCEEYFRYAKQKAKADARIIRELSQKGIASEFARNAIEDVRADAEAEFDDDATSARRTAVQMLRNLTEDGKKADEKFFAKVGRRLFQLGFDSSVIYGVIGDLRRNVGCGSEDE